jgi:hypothetical protein
MNLPESLGGEACLCKRTRAIGFQAFWILASTVLFGCQKDENCTLGTLKNWRFKTRFFASFLCAFAKK